MTYPAHREADVVLRDGSTVRIRPVRAEDEAAVRDFYDHLSLDTVAMRFFTGGVDLKRVTRWSLDVDYHDRFGLVALAGPSQRVVAHAAYTRTHPDRAEVGLEVADDLQGRGVGTILLTHLCEAATENGIGVFEGRVLPQNHRMIDMFRGTGSPLRVRSEPGEVVIEFPTSLSPAALDRFEKREQIAAAAAMNAFLSPRSVAVIGAGRARGTIGGEVFHNLIATGFNGPVYPVNTKADVVQSVRSYHSIGDIGAPVDLAVIVVPAPAVLDAARECAEAGVRAIVVISSGFAEAGGEGIEMQRELLRVCREAGMRLIGPNCMGIVNTAPEVSLDATFAPVSPPHGRVGFLSQSGALGLAVMDHAATLALGLSSFVSVGNKADISGNDLIQYWESDDDTDLILLYLESFGNPRTFARVARRAGKRKPVITVKSGRSQAGARATASHTGAMLAASDVTVDALFQQCGVIRTDTLAEMFDVASLLANQPPPAGDRVAIVTNAGGPGILCADACEAAGLTVVPIPDEVRARLASFLPAHAGLSDPVDMIASATGEDYRRTIEVLAGWDGIDAIIVIFIPPLVTRAAEVAAAIRGAAEGVHIPLVSVFMSSRGVPAELRAGDVAIPSYAFPEDAARALARAARYGAWRRAPEVHLRQFSDVRRDEAAALIATALATGDGWLTLEDTARLLDCYGIARAEQRIVPTIAAAGEAARDLGGTLALKASALGALHRSDIGAVRLGLEGPTQVMETARGMRAALANAGYTPTGFLVQRMAPEGVEALVGVVGDPVFGPVLACGAGGTAAELLHDVSVRLVPVSEEDAREMIRSLRTFPLFRGYRGAPATDVDALTETILRTSALVEAHPEIVEMDLNPVIVSPAGALVVDARIRLERREAPAPLGARRR